MTAASEELNFALPDFSLLDPYSGLYNEICETHNKVNENNTHLLMFILLQKKDQYLLMEMPSVSDHF